MNWEQDRAKQNLCMQYVAEQSRWCRNKRFDGRYCRKHVIEQLEEWERRNPQVVWYLERREALAGDAE